MRALQSMLRLTIMVVKHTIARDTRNRVTRWPSPCLRAWTELQTTLAPINQEPVVYSPCWGSPK